MVDNLYQLYESCLSVWILDRYKQLNKNKNIESLKLLLKLRDINFFKRLNYIILNCRGDLKDPLIQFLIFLIELVDSSNHKAITVSTEHKDKDPSNTFRDNFTVTDDNTLDTFLNTNTDTNRNTVSNTSNINTNLNKNKIFGSKFNKNKLTVVNTTLNTSKTNNVNDNQSSLIDGYVIFINLFLCSLIPTLLYTYLNRVNSNKYNKLQLLHNYYNYINKQRDNDDTSDFNYKQRYSNKVPVYKCFRNESERIVLRCKRFKNLMNFVYSDENKLLDELTAYQILFSSLKQGCSYDIYNNSNDLDNVSGLELVLYKLTLLVNNDFNNKKIYNELPNNIYNIYNKLSSKNILKNQIENNLIYSYRLRINDLNLKLNMNKIFKSLVKYNKNSNSNKYYYPGSVNFTDHSEDLDGFNDLDLLNVMSNSLLLFNNNLLYLNKFLGGINNTVLGNCNRSNKDNKENNTASSNKSKSMFGNVMDLNDVDRLLYYTYNVVNIINGNTPKNKNNKDKGNKNKKKNKKRKNKDKDTSSNKEEREYNSSIEYLYSVLVALMSHIFSLDNDNNSISNNTSNKDNNNEVVISNKYEVFDLKVEGKRRVHLNNNLCLLILKLNYNFYKLLTINSNNYDDDTSKDSNKEDNSSNKDKDKDKDNKDKDSISSRSKDLSRKLTKLLDKIKMRMEYELFPTSYWLVSSYESLLKSKLNSQCQSKPP